MFVFIIINSVTEEYGNSEGDTDNHNSNIGEGQKRRSKDTTLSLAVDK